MRTNSGAPEAVRTTSDPTCTNREGPVEGEKAVLGLTAALASRDELLASRDYPDDKSAGSAEEEELQTALLLAQAHRTFSMSSIDDAFSSPDKTPPQCQLSPLRRWYTVAVFCLTAAILYSDQNLMAPNLSAIAVDFRMGQKEGDRYLAGYVNALFFVVGAPAALLVGFLCSKIDRKKLLVAVIILGEGPCLFALWVTEFWQLVLMRVATGISMGGVFPLVLSLVADLFPVSQRASIASFVQLSAGAGMGVGQALAGFTGPALGWRFAFSLIAAIALVAAALVALTTQEPQRGAMEPAVAAAAAAEGFEYKHEMSWKKLGILLCTPTNNLLIFQGMFGCLPVGIIYSFLNDFLAKQKGLGVGPATVVLLVTGLGGAVGILSGGMIGQRLYNWRKGAVFVFVSACVLAGTAPLYLLINLEVRGRNLPLGLAMGFLCGLFSSVASPNIRAALLNINEPEMRGVALAMQNVLDDVGKGLGPFIVGSLSAILGRKAAFNCIIPGWAGAAAMIGLASCTYRTDEKVMQRRLEEQVGEDTAADVMSIATQSERTGSDVELAPLYKESKPPIAWCRT